MTRQTFAIVGASLAGATAAAALRAEGFDGRIVLIGDEQEPPYERPALSKDFLLGRTEREQLHVHPPERYAELGIELRLGTRVVALDRRGGRIELDAGPALRYDRLLLTTGAAPRQLRVPGGELDGVVTLRTVGDAAALRARLDAAAAVVVVGAGWIGTEVAAAARQRGLDVTVLEPASVPLERVLGAQLGGLYRDIHVDHGVRMLLETGLAAIEGDRVVEGVRTTRDELVPCDLVVVGVGVAPRTELASASGLEVDDGVLVGDDLRTADPRVFAAGDVARAMHPFYGERIRVEHWDNALHQGPMAARAMLGLPASYDRIPYFFSDQYDVGMEYVGYTRAWDRVILRGDPAGRELLAFWMVGDHVAAGMNMNIWDVSEQIRGLIRHRVAVEDRDLADPDVPLPSLLGDVGAGAA